MSGKLDITIEQGSTFSRSITLTDSNNDPIDISNDTFRGQVRKHPKQDVIEASFAFAFITDGTDGKVAMTISHEDTSTMTYGRNVYDIEWVKANGTVTRLLEGTATVTAEVTQ